MTGPAPLSPELLLEHRSFLRALAASLLADEHEADDVVQEAFARALERPPDDRGALRGWLASVVRNASINRLRGAARRGAREADSAREEAVPSSAEIAERLAVQQRVVEAVAGLREPLRTPVYLRFYEGLPPRAIARRLGRPVETVRSQIKRGLALLRAELDDEYGDRRAWGLALLPLAREAARSAAAVAAPAAWIAPLGWVGLLALLGVAAFALASRSTPATRTPPLQHARAPFDDPGGVRGGLPGADPAGWAGASASGAREALGAARAAGAVARAPDHVAGRVLRAFGPRAGAPLGALGITLADASRAEELASDATGRFASTGSFEPGVELVLHDGVERAPLSIARRERLADGSLELFVDVGPTYALDLVLPPGAPEVTALVARLWDPNAPDVDVRARVRPGSLPWVRFAHPPRASLMEAGGRSSWALELVSDDGLWSAVARVHAGREPDRPLALALAARARVAGRTLDASGAPLADVEVVAAADGAPPRRTVSDAHGRFALGALQAGPCSVTLRSHGHASERRALVLAAGATQQLDVELVARALGALDVTLASQSGAHVPEGDLALVALDDPTLRRSLPVLAVRDAARTYAIAIDDLPAGEWELKPPMRDGFAWDPPSLRVRVEDGLRAEARFTCIDDVASLPVAFRVSDADGRPLERFRALVLVDRYRLGVREAAAFEPDLATREARFGEPCARVPADAPLAWVVEAEGHRSQQGRRRELVLEDGVLVADVRLERAWRLCLWVGTEAEGGERALSGAVLSTVGGRELGRTLGDGELTLELLYDPGRLRLALDGWHVERWEGFAFGERRLELDRHRVWLARD